MNFELNDPVLNAYFRVGLGFLHESNPIAISDHTFIWNQNTCNHWTIDSLPHKVPAQTIFSLSPGQVLEVSGNNQEYFVIQFNREFYCVQDHDYEVSCNGILFNGALATPMLQLSEENQRSFNILIEVMKEEFNNKDDVQLEMLRTVLKRFIIKCTRLAKLQYADKLIDTDDLDIVRHFSALVEKYFRTMHKVGEYAAMMNKSPKTLSNVFNALGERTPLQIIHERIILEAKKLLVYTDKSAKEISFELNFSDPVQFSRLFKNVCGQTPIEFKKSGFLSMHAA
ncbi:MAG: helix-turn-helix domain-containing protein [Cyclobacteriaceae bacterium]|nr:helix-turn-helix domain-containing protein [Cyclobacteriaceae bacterium]